MIKEDKFSRSFSRRAFVIGAMQTGALSILGGRLAWIQVHEGSRYKTLADNNRINVKILAPTRGLIVDRNGLFLAENGQNFRVVVIPEQTDDFPALLKKLKRFIKLSYQDSARILKQVSKTAAFVLKNQKFFEAYSSLYF